MGRKNEHTHYFFCFSVKIVSENEIENKNCEKLKIVHHWIWIQNWFTMPRVRNGNNKCMPWWPLENLCVIRISFWSIYDLALALLYFTDEVTKIRKLHSELAD